MRAATSAENRQRVIQCAICALRDGGIASFSLDTIAKSAGVTRLTIYNQFGSRAGLLEAVLDDIGDRSDLNRLPDKINALDPMDGLDLLVAEMCSFWSSDPAIGRLQDAKALDLEFAQAVHSREKRRLILISSLLGRLHPGQRGVQRRDSADLIFSLTNYATFSTLSRGRSVAAVCKLIQTACRKTLDT